MISLCCRVLRAAPMAAFLLLVTLLAACPSVPDDDSSPTPSPTPNPTETPTPATDTDGDGVPDVEDAFPNDPTEWTDADGDGVGSNADCDDTNASQWFDCTGPCFDNDGDGYGDGCTGPDCDDTDATRWSEFTAWMDADGDRFGTEPQLTVCSSGAAPPQYVQTTGDCDDGDPWTFPGAAELESTTECMRDRDYDGYGDANAPAAVTAGSDCDDSDPMVRPGLTDLPEDGIDGSCTGADTLLDDSGFVFVDPADSNCDNTQGTKLAPTCDINVGLALASTQGKALAVAQGNYTTTLATDVSIIGGYGPGWSFDPAAFPTVLNSDSGGPATLELLAGSDLRIQGLVVHGAPPTYIDMGSPNLVWALLPVLTRSGAIGSLSDMTLDSDAGSSGVPSSPLVSAGQLLLTHSILNSVSTDYNGTAYGAQLFLDTRFALLHSSLYLHGKKYNFGIAPQDDDDSSNGFPHVVVEGNLLRANPFPGIMGSVTNIIYGVGPQELIVRDNSFSTSDATVYSNGIFVDPGYSLNSPWVWADIRNNLFSDLLTGCRILGVNSVLLAGNTFSTTEESIHTDGGGKVSLVNNIIDSGWAPALVDGGSYGTQFYLAGNLFRAPTLLLDITVSAQLDNVADVNACTWNQCWGASDNITGDPGFVGNDDFHLSTGSLCIDAGVDPGLHGALLSADMEGIPRPQDGDQDGQSIHDIGAYEFTP